MQSNFEALELKHAKRTLEKDLQAATQIHMNQKERQKRLAEKPSWWKKIKKFFSTLF